MRYLPREDAPFGDKAWAQIDEAVTGSAKSQLAGRRVLDVVGPLGFATRVLDLGEHPADAKATFHDAAAGITAPATLPIPLLHAEFALPIRSLAAAEEGKAPLDTAGAAMAAIACARLEDELIFHGNKALGISGLLSGPGAGKVKLGDWSAEGQAIDDIVKAVNVLDAAGFPGPYTAALAPALYNALFRRYAQGNMTHMDHARQIITEGLVKAPALAAGGVVLAAGKEFARIVLARDMAAAYVGPAGTDYELVILESVCPLVTVREAVCVLESKA
jgi:uncharacterized linocin/CFP29 family protein